MKTVKKITVTLLAQNAQRVAKLMEKCEATDLEVILNALQLFEDAVKEADQGAEFFIRRKDNGAIVEWPIFGDKVDTVGIS